MPEVWSKKYLKVTAGQTHGKTVFTIFIIITVLRRQNKNPSAVKHDGFLRDWFDLKSIVFFPASHSIQTLPGN